MINNTSKTCLTLVLIILLRVISYAQEDVLWKFKTNGRVYSSALLDNGTVYFGSGDHNIYAVSQKTGEKIWEYETEGAVHSSATTYRNLVYFSSADGNLYALDKISGKLIWKFASEGEQSYGLWDYYLSSPQVADGVVFWGSGDGHLYAIDGVSGKVKWKYKTGDIVHASPVIKDNRVYFGSFDGVFYVLDTGNGAVIWKFKTIGDTYFPKGEIQKSALVHDGMVYFGSRDYNIYALNIETGTGNWNMKEGGGWVIATPIAYKDNVYFGTSDGHAYYAMHKKSGKMIWKTPLSMRVYGAAVAHQDVIYFGSFDGKLLGLDYQTGEIKWAFQTEKSKQNYSTIYTNDGHFNKDFELYGKDYIATEAKIHELGSILSTPVIAEEVIYFGSSDGYFYAVKLQ
jgi:outer membrane protein assembly factor BamB